MTFTNETIVSIAAPKIQAELGLRSAGVQWAINAYVWTMGVFFASVADFPTQWDTGPLGSSGRSAR
jgi:hypothetical protein